MNNAKLVCAIAALMGSGTALAQVPQWTVSESSGSVSILRPGFSGAAARGGVVRAGDTVATGKGGRAVLVRGEEYLVVSPGSRIVVADPKPGGMTQIIQKLGNTLFKIKKMATPHFAVETPFLAAVVKGTTFSVTVTQSGASVQVTEGRVQVQTPDGGASYLVTPGVVALVDGDRPYRLKILGREVLTIDSPAAPAESKLDGAAGSDAPISGSDAARGDTISVTVGEGPVSLATLSNGLVSGDSTLISAGTVQRQPAIASVVQPAPIAAPPAPSAALAALPSDSESTGSIAVAPAADIGASITGDGVPAPVGVASIDVGGDTSSAGPSATGSTASAAVVADGGQTGIGSGIGSADGSALDAATGDSSASASVAAGIAADGSSVDLSATASAGLAGGTGSGDAVASVSVGTGTATGGSTIDPSATSGTGSGDAIASLPPASGVAGSGDSLDLATTSGGSAGVAASGDGSAALSAAISVDGSGAAAVDAGAGVGTGTIDAGGSISAGGINASLDVSSNVGSGMDSGTGLGDVPSLSPIDAGLGIAATITGVGADSGSATAPRGVTDTGVGGLVSGSGSAFGTGTIGGGRPRP